jgi:hypothetical protein
MAAPAEHGDISVRYGTKVLWRFRAARLKIAR